MSVVTGGWELIREATANRQVDAIISEYIDSVDLQLPLLHALYEMLRLQMFQEVALILRAVQGEWL